MKTYAVKLSDGEEEWTEKFNAENEDHLMDIIDTLGWDVVDYKEVK